MAGVIGLRGPDIEKRDALRGYNVVFEDADRPYVRPHTGLPVLRLSQDGPEVHRHVFGFTRRFSSFNARSENLATSRMWSKMYRRRAHHGIAPVSYILEWGDLGDGQGKRPFRIERADGGAMCVPALVGPYWEEKGVDAFALVTVPANDFVDAFHDRMIGQLPDELVDTWLDPGSGDVESCLRRPPNEELVAYPLRKDIAAARFDDVQAMQATGDPITWDDVQRIQGRGGPRQATL